MQHAPEDTHATRIARILADRIITGEIAPGTRLRQDHIATEFGASHVPVREAFRELQAQGLAESLPRRGFRVTEFDVAELREVAEMRASLERLALRHAAPHLTRAILAEAEEVTRRDWEARTDHDHRAILEALRKGQTDLACSTLARHVGWIGKRKAATKNAAPRETYEILG